MCSRGTIKTCIGACGLMSLKAISRSSSYTFDAGISPAMMRQNRQLILGLYGAKWAASHDDSRDAGEVRDNSADGELRRCRGERPDRIGLAAPNLEEQPPSRPERPLGRREQHANHVQAV